jgi:hypothetical protein
LKALANDDDAGFLSANDDEAGFLSSTAFV